MKYHFFIILSLLFSVYSVSANEEQKKTEDRLSTISGLSWYSDINTAFNIAQQENKNVIVMVGEENCKWCNKMKKRTLTDIRIKDKFQAYILVSIKRSDEVSVKYLPEFDGNIPSFFFMKSNKELIEPIVGYFAADDFLQYIKEIEE